jgi:hypothetical protein
MMMISKFSKLFDNDPFHSRLHPLKRLVCVLSLAVVSVLPVENVCAQCDDFNDGEDAGWTRYDPISTVCTPTCPQNTWNFTNGAYRIQAKPSPNPALGWARAASLREDVVYTGFYVTVDLVDWDETVPQAFGIVAGVRELGLGRTDGYAFTYRVNRQTIYINRFTDEVPLTPHIGGGIGSYTMIKGRTYRFVFQRVGDQFRGEMYELPEINVPVLSAVAIDNTYPSGFCGLLATDFSNNFNSIADATFDNYCAAREEPVRLSISTPNSFMESTISWPVRFSGYVLESAPVLPAIIWMPELHLSDDTKHYFTADATDGMRFYRLRKALAPE